jgi:hypothetical protein
VRHFVAARGVCYAAPLPQGGDAMKIEGRRFMELAIHVKLASEAIVAAARNLAALRPPSTGAEAGAWQRTMDELVTMNVELGFMERILRNAAGGDVRLPAASRNGRIVTQ